MSSLAISFLFHIMRASIIGQNNGKLDLCCYWFKMNCKSKLLIVCKQASEVINKEKYSPLNLSITVIMSQKESVLWNQPAECTRNSQRNLPPASSRGSNTHFSDLLRALWAPSPHWPPALVIWPILLKVELIEWIALLWVGRHSLNNYLT